MRPDAWPLPRPAGWAEVVNATMAAADFEPVRTSLLRGRPLGSERWVAKTAQQLGLEFTLRPRGRPRKKKR